MCKAAPPPSPSSPTSASDRPVLEQLVELGLEINTNHYRTVHLAAQYATSLQWYNDGLSSAALGISRELDIHTTTAREWIRVGHALACLPLIDYAFATNRISYAKARILTRHANEELEQDLLDLAVDRTTDQLTNAIARLLDQNDPDDDAKDQRHHDYRSFTTYTNDDGMTVLRAVLPPGQAKPIIAAIDELVRNIATTPETNTETASEAPTTTSEQDAPAGAPKQPTVTDPEEPATQSGQHAPAGASLPFTLNELRQRWQPDQGNDGYLPTYDQQRADAFAVLFLRLPIKLTTELVIHIAAEGNTFDATNRRRHPTARQKRLVSAQHSHECVDCGTTILIEYDHNPPYEQTHHTITNELEPRCAPCHRARHRHQTGRQGGYREAA